jgi:hypothetical protein
MILSWISLVFLAELVACLATRVQLVADHIEPDFASHKGLLRKRHLEKRGVRVKAGRAIPFAPRGADKSMSFCSLKLCL